MKKAGTEEEELGFGNKVTGKDRLVGKDGSFMVRRKGQNALSQLHVYDRLINMSWMRFNLLVIGAYIVLNFLFAILYFTLCPGEIQGIVASDEAQRFKECFFFSAQTITTVGYGRISPLGGLSSTIAAVESLIGLLGFALATGLLYGRFSKPRADLMYTAKAVVAPFKNGRALMFRIANEKTTQLIETEVQVVFARMTERDGKLVRDFRLLPLELNKVSFMALTWTIVAPITEDSPLWGYTPEKLEREKGEFLVLIKAFHDSFATTIYSRSSYRFDEIEWDKKFESLIELDASGHTVVRMDKFNNIL